MLSFVDARSRILSGVARLSTERVPLVDAAGRVLAEDIVAADPLPNFDHSAMDGYALTIDALRGEPPWTLRVVGESSAGRTPPMLAHEAACRIFTGAEVPAGADTVVMQENANREGDTIRLEDRPKRGQHIRRAGEDLAIGAVALVSGSRLSAGELALAAMVDRAELLVARRPRVTVLCTGSELRAPGTERRPAMIPESNSAPLVALARQAGAAVRVARIARDDAADTEQAIGESLDGTDVLLTVGGASVGDHDVVRPALERAGVTLDFWKVAIKPGKPLVFGSRGNTRVLGLPGNPASAIVTFALFGLPLLRLLQGDARATPTALPVQLAQARRRSPDRLEFVRAKLGRSGDALVARIHDNQASGAATSLAGSDGLALVPPGDSPLETGASLDFVRWVDM
jgi:molybdopterin molybdotransferase